MVDGKTVDLLGWLPEIRRTSGDPQPFGLRSKALPLGRTNPNQCLHRMFTVQPVTVAKPRQGSCLSHFFVTKK